MSPSALDPPGEPLSELARRDSIPLSGNALAAIGVLVYDQIFAVDALVQAAIMLLLGAGEVWVSLSTPLHKYDDVTVLVERGT